MAMMLHNVTLLFLVLSHADSNLDTTLTMLVILRMGRWSLLFHLVGGVLGDFPVAVVAKANKLGVEKSRHSIATTMRLTIESTKTMS